MANTHRALTADERLARLKKDQARVRRERLARSVAGPAGRRCIQVVPAFFQHAGVLTCHVLEAPREDVIHALRADAIFAVDTAMRLAHGAGFLSSGDVQAYLSKPEVLTRLIGEGLLKPDRSSDTTLVRPYPGPPRLLACITPHPPPSVVTADGYTVVDPERLRRELVGTVGARADLFALLERLQQKAAEQP